MLHSSLLFHRKFVEDLKSYGFELNPCDPVEETGAVPATSIDRAIQFKSKHCKQDERKEITLSH